MKQDLLEIVEKRIDMPGIVEDTLNKILEPSLQELVDSTDTDFDNIAKATLMPILGPKLVEMTKKYWDLVDGKTDPPTAA